MAALSQLWRICCKLNSCSHPAPPAEQLSVTPCPPSKQTDGYYMHGFCKKKKKKVCNHFHEAPGCCISPAAHKIWFAKRNLIWTCTKCPTVFAAMCFLHKPPPSTTCCPTSLLWSTPSYAGSEIHCVVDNLLTAPTHLMYGCVVDCSERSSCTVLLITFCLKEGEMSAGQP